MPKRTRRGAREFRIKSEREASLNPFENNQPGGGTGRVATQHQSFAFGKRLLTGPNSLAFAEMRNFNYGFAKVFNFDRALVAQCDFAIGIFGNIKRFSVDDKIVRPFEG